MQANEELARRINEEALSDPSSPYAGKYVGIANGQVVVVADTLDEVMDRLLKVEPDPTKCRALEASADETRVDYVWGYS